MGFFVESDNIPTGGICFRNIEQTPIRILPDDYDVEFNPNEFYRLDPRNFITFSFSSPESIDFVIFVLKYVKRIAFKNEHKRKNFMKANQIFKSQLEDNI